MVVPRHFIIQILTPRIEYSSLDLIALDHVRQVDVLVAERKRLERVDVPLVKRDFLAVAAQFVADDAECFKFVMTALVEA